MHITRKYILLIVCILLSCRCFAFETLAYTWRGFPTDISGGTRALDDLKKHASQINYWSSQAYHLDEKGLLYGSLNPEMLQIANDAHIKVMPLIGNKDFDHAKTHTFLKDPEAQSRAMESILALCKAEHFAGVQIDFEGILYTDRDAFSDFYARLANLLHQNGFQISAAIMPQLTDKPPASDYLKSRFIGSSGAYDYKRLGESSDFITLMSYDQHGALSPPGPVSGQRWNEAVIQYALKYVPANKLSLGIPLHSAYWFTGGSGSNVHAVSVTVNYDDAVRIMADNHATPLWSNEDKNHYAVYMKNFLYEYLFLEDAASYQAKIDLVNKYHLRGISNWCLGEEDPAIWNVLKNNKS